MKLSLHKPNFVLLLLHPWHMINYLIQLSLSLSLYKLCWEELLVLNIHSMLLLVFLFRSFSCIIWSIYSDISSSLSFASEFSSDYQALSALSIGGQMFFLSSAITINLLLIKHINLSLFNIALTCHCLTCTLMVAHKNFCSLL